MALTPHQSQRISAAVGQKVRLPCPLCGVMKWTWGQDLIVLQTTRYLTAAEPVTGLGSLAPGQPQQQRLSVLASLAGHFYPDPPPPAYPLLSLQCGNCGNTMFLNVYTLGLADIWPDIAAARVG